MHLFTIIWTLTCAAIIAGYSIYLFNKSFSFFREVDENTLSMASNKVELLSFDLKSQSPGWSFKLNVPQITEEVLYKNPILFYLESSDSCLKLPLNNATVGYCAYVYKNTGKVYVTFKSLADGVSNFYVPTSHVSKLKIMIIKSRDKRLYGDWGNQSAKSYIFKELKKAGVNINDYEDTLSYFSNIAAIEFKGHFKESNKTVEKQPNVAFLQNQSQKLSSTG
ncbi:hypothetical protein HME9304_01928 [Flagellimonas maritima]|uniref:Uncharacterized protein n=1 Tax=Flagellimonas maritima TaxID=1383885 RepID=A0A2Z4LT75_9FLAO|nr:hypothetical protein [Allomuricauda aurantiaca]AWX44922.1 hypothetical protein HME9304_01928 [Allomuricauda aurantiaca]